MSYAGVAFPLLNLAALAKFDGGNAVATLERGAKGAGVSEAALLAQLL